MASSTIFPIKAIDQWVAEEVGSRPSPSPFPFPFPVARRIGGLAPDGHVHLVDGDGASLCEAVTQDQLERLPVAWADVVAGARCRGCEVLVRPSVPDGHSPDRDEQVAQQVDGSLRTATCSSVTAPVDDRSVDLSTSVVAARRPVGDARRARTQTSRRPIRRDGPGSTAPVTAGSTEDVELSPELRRRHSPGAQGQARGLRGEESNRPGSAGRRPCGKTRDGNTTNGWGRDEGREP